MLVWFQVLLWVECVGAAVRGYEFVVPPGPFLVRQQRRWCLVEWVPHLRSLGQFLPGYKLRGSPVRCLPQGPVGSQSGRWTGSTTR